MESLQFDSALAQGDDKTHPNRHPEQVRNVVVMATMETFSARVEVLRRKQGAYSGIKAVCFLICIGRDAPFGAKPP